MPSSDPDYFVTRDEPAERSPRLGRLGSVKLIHPMATVGPDGRTTCPVCGATSFDPSVLEEINCFTPDGPRIEAITSRPPNKEPIYIGSTEPAFPQIGDIWIETDTTWVRIGTDDGEAWSDFAGTGGLRTGQLSFPGGGYNPMVRRATTSGAITTEMLDLADDSDMMVRHYKRALNKQFQAYLEKEDLIRITPIVIDWQDDPPTKTIIIRLTAMVRPMPTEGI